MPALADRLARAALAGVLHELQGDPTGAADVLARLFGDRALCLGAHPIATAEEGQPETGSAMPHPSGQPAERDDEPHDDDDEPRPTPLRSERTGQRNRKTPTKSSRTRPTSSGEAVDLVQQLAERHGTVRDAAKAIGIHEQQLQRYRGGKQVPTPATLERLRAAVAKGAEPGEDAPDLPGDDAG